MSMFRETNSDLISNAGDGDVGEDHSNNASNREDNVDNDHDQR